MQLTNQQGRVLARLQEHGSIDPLQAWKECGVYRLSAVILELRNAGFAIETKRKPVLNRFEETCHVGHYIYHGHLDDVGEDPDLYPDPINEEE